MATSRRFSRYLLFLWVLGGPALVWAQPESAPARQQLQGYPPFIQNVTPTEYEAHHQNWDLVEDERGLIYAANTHGVLEYDGDEWRLISTVNQSPVRSLAVGADGRVFVGASGEIGFLAPDERGKMEYVSLRDRLPAGGIGFTQNVWGAHAADSAVYFQTYNRLLRWKEGSFKTWRFADTLHTSFLLRDTLVVRQEGRGLLQLRQDSLTPLEGGSHFARTSVYALVPRGESGYLAASWDEGLFVYEGNGVRRVGTSGSQYAQEHHVYHGVAVRDSLLALATPEGGVVILDPSLRVQTVLDEDAGLQDNRAYALYEGRGGGLWAGLYRGLARIQLSATLSRFDARNDLYGAVQSVTRHRGSIFVGTMRGLYVASREEAGPIGRKVRFEPVSGLENNQIWALLSTEDGLLAGGGNGIDVIRGESGGRAVRSIDTEFVFDLRRSRHDSERVLVATQSGMMTLGLRNGRWSKGPTSEGIGGAINSFGEDSTGRIWYGARGRGVGRVRFDRTGGLSESPVLFGRENGLPRGLSLVADLDGSPLVVTGSDTLLRPTPLDAPGDSVRFEAIGVLPDELGPADQGPGWIHAEGKNVLWTGAGREVRRFRIEPGDTASARSTHRLRFPSEEVLGVDPAHNAAWLGTSRGLIRWAMNGSPGMSSDPLRPPSVLVRRVTVGRDSLLFGGTHGRIGSGPQRVQPAERDPRVPFTHNRVTLGYASPPVAALGATQYQYRLLEFEEEWSEWTSETEVTYPYVPFGDYRFEVRARSMWGLVSEPAVYRFSVAPPWYRTWTAYFLYGIGLLVALVGFIRYRTALSRRKLEQEQILTERLQEANEELRKTNKMKDEFLANLSHEIRTPMASIQGFADVLAEEVREENEEFVELIQTSSQRLHDTLTSLMELAQLRADVIEPTMKWVDVREEVRDAADMFRRQAEEKGLEFSVVVPDSSVTAYLDDFCLERIVNNLVSNAIKFTEEGEVKVLLRATRNTVILRVSDEGEGISDKFLPQLFNAFRQESVGLNRSHEGIGLGLAITHQMVEILNGSISVESEKGEGTTFTVRLPRNRQDPPSGRTQTTDSSFPDELERSG